MNLHVEILILQDKHLDWNEEISNLFLNVIGSHMFYFMLSNFNFTDEYYIKIFKGGDLYDICMFFCEKILVIKKNIKFI